MTWIIKICEYCNEEYDTRFKNQRFCSLRCVNKNRWVNGDLGKGDKSPHRIRKTKLTKLDTINSLCNKKIHIDIKV